MMKKLIEDIAKAIVDDHDKIEVNEIAGEETTVIELKVSKDEVGKIIGKGGKTALAIRTIMWAHASKSRRRAVLEIIE